LVPAIGEQIIGDDAMSDHLFSLEQAVELFEYYQEKIAECESAG